MNLAAMMRKTSLCVALCLSFVSYASAGPLAGDLAISYGGAWAGSTPFATGTLVGYVDWAVYGPGAFPYAGYVPTPGQLTYAYQVYVTGAAPLSHFDVDLAQNPGTGNNIGNFPLAGGQGPTVESISALLASWDFAGVPTGGNTAGLAFSSDRVPFNGFGGVIDTGQSTIVMPIPVPSDILIPEPGSLVLLGVCLAFAVPAVRRFRRG